MKRQILFKMVFVALAFIHPCCLWAEIGTITIMKDSFPTVKKYGTDDKWQVIASTGETITGYADLASTGEFMQMNSSSSLSHPYNVDALPGAITKITLVGSGENTPRKWIPYLSAEPLTNETYYTKGIALEAKTPLTNVSSISWEIDAGSDYRYFYLLLKGGATSLGRIEIEYELVPVSVAAPAFSLPAGMYYEPQSITLDCETEGATIYYTTDGTEPTDASTPYTGAITIDRTTTLKAIAYKDGKAGDVATCVYTFPVVPQLYVSGFAGDALDFGQVERGSSKELTFAVSGKGLSGDVVLTVDNQAFTLSESVLRPDEDGILPETTLVLTYMPKENGMVSARLVIAAAGLEEDMVISVCATCIAPVLQTPEAEEATNITSTGFTARWRGVEYAAYYELHVWEGASDDMAADRKPVAGSPFIVTEGNSYPVGGLAANSLYSYSVVAKADGYADSPAGALIKVMTAPQGPVTGTWWNTVAESIRFDGKLVSNPDCLPITLYNVAGWPVTVGTGDIDMRTLPSGIYFLKTDRGVMKLIK